MAQDFDDVLHFSLLLERRGEFIGMVEGEGILEISDCCWCLVIEVEEVLMLRVKGCLMVMFM